MKESNMPKDDPINRTTNEQAAEMRAWGSIGRVADDALTALETSNAKQVGEHLEAIRDVAAKKAGNTRTWRKMVRLPEDALRAVNAGNEKMIRECPRAAAMTFFTKCRMEGMLTPTYTVFKFNGAPNRPAARRCHHMERIV